MEMKRLIAIFGGDTGGNWSAHCITRWPWFTLCFVVCVPLSHIRKEGGYSEGSSGDEWRADRASIASDTARDTQV